MSSHRQCSWTKLDPASEMILPRSSLPSLMPGAPTKKVEVSAEGEGRRKSATAHKHEGKPQLTVEVRQIKIDRDVVEPRGEPLGVPLGIDGDLRKSTVRVKRQGRR
jgi:hypothetical protein